MSSLPFAPGQRKTVLWIGPPVPKPVLAGACDERGLVLRVVNVDELQDLAPESRAVLLPVARADSAFMKRARVAAQHSARHGMLLALVMSNEASPPHPPSQAEVKEYYKAFGKLQADGFRVVGFDYQWVEIASRLAGLLVRAGENRSLVITGVDLDEEKASLLRQAFYDYRSLHVEALDGGKSGARTLRISEGETPAKNRPFVAKLSTPDKIEIERSGYMLIEQRVPSRLYAPLVEDRCRSGQRDALAVYRFMEHCDPLSARLDDVGVKFVDHLFEQTLRDLHQPASNAVASITEIFGENGCKLLRWSDALVAAGVECQGRGASVPGATELRALIDELPRHDYKTGAVHGDLHIGNLFVPDGSCEAVIIDYGSVRSGQPLHIDPACLEVSLAFPPAFVHRKKPAERAAFREQFLGAYKYPLRPGSARQLQSALGPGCASMIGRIRVVAAQMDSNPVGYPIAVAACLMRYASYADSASVEDRALAYELAARLFSDAGVAMHQRKAKRIGGS